MRKVSAGAGRASTGIFEAAGAALAAGEARSALSSPSPGTPGEGRGEGSGFRANQTLTLTLATAAPVASRGTGRGDRNAMESLHRARDFPRAMKGLPRAVRDFPRAMKDLPRAMTGFPRAITDVLRATRDVPRGVRDVPRAVGEGKIRLRVTLRGLPANLIGRFLSDRGFADVPRPGLSRVKIGCHDLYSSRGTASNVNPHPSAT